jgi:hypothetical protein
MSKIAMKSRDDRGRAGGSQEGHACWMLLTFFFEGEKEERERERERTSLNRRHEEKEQETLLRGIYIDRPPFLHREQILFDALCPDSNQRPHE